SVARAVEDAIRRSQRFRLVAASATMPRIIINMYSIDPFNAPQFQGHLSAIAISVVYYGKGTPGAGVFLNMAVNGCGPEIIEQCAKNLIPTLVDAVDFLQRHDPELWNTL